VMYTAEDADFGKYLGPGSRCIRQSPGFARKGFEAADSIPSAGCYKVICKGDDDDRQVYIRFEGPDIEIPCPSGALIQLDTVKGEHQNTPKVLSTCAV
jgi:hypothetical protein